MEESEMKIGNLEIERDFVFVTIKPLAPALADKRLVINCLLAIYKKKHADKKTRLQLKIDSESYRLALMHEENLLDAIKAVKIDVLPNLMANFRHQYLKPQKKMWIRDFSNAKVEIKRINVEELYIQTNLTEENE